MFPASLLMIGLAGLAATRDWRYLIVLSVIAGFAATLGTVWPGGAVILSYGPGSLRGTGGAAALPTVAALASGLPLLLAMRIVAHRRFEDPLAVAAGLALKDVAVPVLAFCAVLSLALIPANPWIALVAAASGLLLLPALLAAIEILLPRTRSVEDMYGRRPKS
jgi:hypothetical protein